MKRWSLVAALGLSAAAASPAAAQLPGLFPAGSYVKDVWYPKLFWTPRDGATVGGYFAIVAPLRYADFDNPAPHVAALSLDGQVSTSGTRFLTLDAFAPSLVRGWRLRVTGSAERWNRENYFGLGEASTIDDANQSDSLPHFYRARHVRHLLRAEVQRRVVGPVRLLAGLHAERWTIEPLEPVSQLATDRAAGIDPTIGRATGDVAVRFGLIVDTRVDESAPDRGLLFEAIHGIADADIAGDLSYTRTTVSLRGFLPIGETLILGGRLAGQRMGGTPRLGSYAVIESTDGPFTGLGGAVSHRALVNNRYLGRSTLFANLDLRYALIYFPRVSLLAFVDAGRVFEQESFRITFDGLAVGGGTGLFLQLARNGIAGMTVGLGPDGLAFDFHTKWSF
ncbi:MAG TPA: BamA/TamA family outer membrane protein [Gemmatimonadales bacterium]